MAKITIFRAMAEIAIGIISRVFYVDMKFRTLRISLDLTWMK